MGNRRPFAPMHSALWLPLLSERDLNYITIDSYAARTRSGFESERHNFGGLWPWEEEAFSAYIPPSSRIIVAAAGGGREMIPLARMGHQVTGFDATPDLVEACRLHLKQAKVAGQIHLAPAAAFPAGLDQKQDALIVGRGAYHHIVGRTQRIAFLAAGRAHLVEGAPLILGDFHIRDEHESPPFLAFGRAERGDWVGSAFFHYFTRSEITAELEEAGFELIDWRLTPFRGATLAHAIAKAR